MADRTYEAVKVWSETVVLPTYEAGQPDKNPMFLEKRVYQGSTGKVYPHTVIDKLSDTKIDKEYLAVYLENEFIKVMVLPELGGRIHRATDKTNGYDFVYYNHVIKPALVGLAGPWISGGIEFNWPQHHRPSTFDAVDYTTCSNADGSASIVVGEIEQMFRTKGMARFTLYPDATYIEIKAQLYNRTNVPQTFLWWANPAVPVNEHTRSIFPPDVTAVMDHGKRAVSAFPIAKDTYYKIDYSKGVDISRYCNLPVPTSYMAAHSDFDFVGGYDDQLDAGILHVADHHVAPGKKQWTWGCGDFGKAWDRNLTDEDGPYVELMTGCFTDNQPDFAWLAPMEEKRFTQYFMPYQKLGTVHNANRDLAMNVMVEAANITSSFYAMSHVGTLGIAVFVQDALVKSESIYLEPTQIVSIHVPMSAVDATQVKVVVTKNGKEFLQYQAKMPSDALPEAAQCPPDPKDCKTNENLYLYGLHIEQYRHATYDAKDYYLEGLARDATDVRLNNAYGLLLFRAGLFADSEQYFRTAIKKSIRSNPNPYDSEPYYNLGLALFYQDQLSDAYDAFFKAAWSNSCQEGAFYFLACISARQGDYIAAYEHAENAVIKNGRNYNALNLQVVLLRKLGKTGEAIATAKQIRALDALDLVSRRELELLTNADFHFEAHLKQEHTAIEIAIEYAQGGFYEDAVAVLATFIKQKSVPMVHYYLAFYNDMLDNSLSAVKERSKGELASPLYCFPHRLEDMVVLEHTTAKNESDAKAHYYLGNLLYDKRRYEQAIDCFTRSVKLDNSFATPHRNLSLAYFNQKGDAQRAKEELERAFALDNTDARVLMELDQLYKKLCVSPEERLQLLQAHMDIVVTRDDLYLEYITLLNLTAHCETAFDLLMHHQFHPWEGGEGKAPAQYVYALVNQAQKAMKQADYQQAIAQLKQTFSYPHNLGEGKLYGTQENQANYYLGTVYQAMGNEAFAQEQFKLASMGLSEPQSAMYYNDQPPETIFYQGMALVQLGQTQEAMARFNKLIEYGDAHYDDVVKIDYFAVSLPDFLVFNEDLDMKNKVHCLFMKALGTYGKGQVDEANNYLQQAKSMDNNHFGINSHISLLN